MIENNLNLMEKIFPAALFVLFIFMSCNDSNKMDEGSECQFNEEDSSYIFASMEVGFRCMSYYWVNCQKGIIETEIHINDTGAVTNVVILKNETMCGQVETDIKVKFQYRNFIGLQINNPCSFKFTYNFTTPATSPCIPDSEL